MKAPNGCALKAVKAPKGKILCYELTQGDKVWRGPVKKRARKGLTGAGPRISTPKLFTARSLIGMTMGARKRSARRFECPGCMECGGLDKPKLEPWRCYGEDIDLGKEQWRPYHRCPNMRRIYRQHRAKYRIGERLRPCLGCCACWGCEQDPTRIFPLSGNTLHWGGPRRLDTFQCPMGPPLVGKSKQQIARMREWQNTLPDDCDGSGVLPAKS